MAALVLIVQSYTHTLRVCITVYDITCRYLLVHSRFGALVPLKPEHGRQLSLMPSKSHCPAEINLCPFPELVPWHCMMG